MAKIVLGIGMSHSPMMGLEGSKWNLFAEADVKHPMLYDSEGNKVDYEDLEKKVGNQFEQDAQPDNLAKLSQEMENSFDRLYEDFKNAELDAVIVISNDHPNEWFDTSNVPALGVFYGEEVISGKVNFPPVFKFRPEVVQEMSRKMGMDDYNVWPGSKEIGEHLIVSLMDKGFDVAAMKEAKDPSTAGHGHGYGFVVTELMRDKLIPMVPVYLNSWPPNELSPSRCYDLGIAIRKAIEELPGDLRIGVVASGGLSHFVTDRDLDDLVIEALKNRDEKTLRELPRHRLKAGNSEIRNWVVLEAAIRNLAFDWHHYIPVFRTPVGTGIGMTFARWS
ncbi:hypothetical protein BTR23_10800 [Alkalihalophilus pseudofirmus]|nr:hypothetical protein BTR23_10800 [Alkalihalophilus pseudofirmus]